MHTCRLKQRDVKDCPRRACGPAMRALLLHQAQCPINVSNSRSYCPFWRHTELRKRAAAAAPRAVVAQSAATEAGTHKCASGRPAPVSPSVSSLVSSLHATTDSALPYRWAADTEAAPSNNASQEFPDNGGMRICVNSTYDSGNIEVTQYSSTSVREKEPV